METTMKLRDLFEEAKFDAEKEQTALIKKMKGIKDEIKKLQSKSASVVQNGIAPQYKSQWDRLQAAKKATQDDLNKIESRAKASDSTHKFHQEFATKRATEPESEKKKRFGDAVSQGLIHNNSERKEVGGYAGVARKMLDYVRIASKDGAEKVTVEDLTHHFDTSARTINRWLERPEFTQVARLMGRR